MVVIKEHSAGNESVGEMWKETKIFDELATLKDVMDWALSPDEDHSRRNIILTKACIGATINE